MTADPDELVPDVVWVLVNKHAHGKRTLPRMAVNGYADGDVDADIMNAAIDKACAELSFVIEHPKDQFKIKQTEELVDYLVQECDGEPEFFKADLHHIPPDVWDKYGVTPPHP